MADSDWIDDDEGWVDDKPQEGPGYLESLGRGIAQGASMGFADEITGALESAFTDKTYKQARDESRANYKAAKDANPATYGTGEIGAGIATAFVPGLNLAKGASLAKTAGQAALMGGLVGAGQSEESDIIGLAKDTATGAALGGTLGGAAGYGIQKAAPLVERGLQKGSEFFGDAAERLAGRALGAERNTVKSLGLDSVKSAGRQALDEGILTPFASTDDLISRNEAVKARGGRMMGEVYDAIDEKIAPTFDPLRAASSVDEELGGFWRSPLNKAETNQFENTLESILMRGDQPIPLKDAQLLKQELGRAANWKNTLQVTPKEQMARDAYGIVSTQIDDAVQKGSAQLDNVALSKQLAEGKALYSKSSDASKLLQNKQAREEGNKLLGLTDYSILGGGLGAGVFTGGASIPATLAITGGKKLSEKYGAQNAALASDKISKILRKSPRIDDLFKNSPQAANALVQRLESRLSAPKAAENQNKPPTSNALIQKSQGTKYSQVLSSAAQRGEQAVASTNFILQQTDPEYRRLMLEGDENDQRDSY